MRARLAAPQPRDPGARVHPRARRSRSSRPRPRSTRGATRPRAGSTTRATASSTGRRSRTTPTSPDRRSSDRVTSAQALQNSINSVFCDIGKELGPLHRPRLREALRLLRRTAARDARRRALAKRPLVEGRPLRSRRSERGRPRAARVRSGADARDAAPDGDGRGRRSQTTASSWSRTSCDRIVGARRRRDLAHDARTSCAGVMKSDRRRPRSRAMMVSVVESGTATAAQIPGVQVAGKTGTAETGRFGQNDTWFHRVRAGRRPRGGGRGRSLQNQSGTGGAGRRADRQGSDGGASSGESLGLETDGRRPTR